MGVTIGRLDFTATNGATSAAQPIPLSKGGILRVAELGVAAAVAPLKGVLVLGETGGNRAVLLAEGFTRGAQMGGSQSIVWHGEIRTDRHLDNFLFHRVRNDTGADLTYAVEWMEESEDP